MKGPGLRINLDVRRVWKCPECDSVQKTEGNVVVRRCRCTRDGTWMKLVEAPVSQMEPEKE